MRSIKKLIFTLIIPGQFGPINRVLLCLINLCFTRTMSCCGIPSVIHTTSGISASIDSKMAAPAPDGGTYMTEAVAPVESLACKTNAKREVISYSATSQNLKSSLQEITTCHHYSLKFVIS